MNAVAILIPAELSRDEVEAVSVLCAARLDRYLADRAKYLRAEEPEVCETCDGEGVTLDWSDPVVKPCRKCRREEYVAFCARRAAEQDLASGGLEAAVVAQSCHTGPDVLRNPASGPVAEGNGDGIERRDPWSLSDEELADGTIRLTARELCDAESGRGSGSPSSRHDRASYDEHESLDDLQPFERTTKYTWGPR